MGKRPVLTPDEVLRLPIDEALVIIRGKKTLKVDKMDYSKHPDYPLLRSCKASAHVPEWRRLEMEAEEKKAEAQEARRKMAEGKGETVEAASRAGKKRTQKAAAKETTDTGHKNGSAKDAQIREKTVSGSSRKEGGKAVPQAGSADAAKSVQRTDAKTVEKQKKRVSAAVSESVLDSIPPVGIELTDKDSIMS